MKTEHANYQQSGFICVSCGIHMKTYNGEVPGSCPACGADGTMKMEWNQKLNLIATVEPLPLAPFVDPRPAKDNQSEPL